MFCRGRDGAAAGPFPINDNGRLALAISPCRSNWVAVYEVNERRFVLLLVDEGFRNRGVIAGDCAGVSTAGGKGGGESGVILLGGVGRGASRGFSKIISESPKVLVVEGIVTISNGPEIDRRFDVFTGLGILGGCWICCSCSSS